MTLKIEWSTEAEITYLNILNYLEANWSKREVLNFIKRTETVLNKVSNYPYLYKESPSTNARIAFIGKQNSLYYRVINSKIYLLTFWDNRLDPSKNRY